MLENMLDDISNPVAFASAPLGIDAQVQATAEVAKKRAEEKRLARTAEAERVKRGAGKGGLLYLSFSA